MSAHHDAVNRGVAAEDDVDVNVALERGRERLHALKVCVSGLLVQDDVTRDAAIVPEVA